jgi:integrase
MQEQFRLGKHRGAYVAVKGRGRNKQRRSLGIKAKPNLREDARRQVHALNALGGRPKVDGTVGSVYAAYVADREHDQIPSVHRMKSAWKPLEPHFGHLTPDMIDKRVCTTYIAQRRKKGVSNGGIKTELDYLSTALGFGKREKLYVGDRPAIERPPAGRPRERYLTHEEADKLIRGARAFHIRLFIQLSLTSAGRPSHILQLTWNRVDLNARALNLDNPDRDATKKGRARVPINDDALEALKVAREMATTEWVVEYNGGPVLRVNRGVEDAARRARLKGISPYVLRHTAGVWMAQAGVPMAEISQYMGHSGTHVTERVYARFHPDYLRRASDALRLSGKPRQIEDGRGE